MWMCLFIFLFVRWDLCRLKIGSYQILVHWPMHAAALQSIVNALFDYNDCVFTVEDMSGAGAV